MIDGARVSVVLTSLPHLRCTRTFVTTSLPPPLPPLQDLAASNDFSLLPELHAASAGLKSYCSSMAAAGIEMCRRVRLCAGVVCVCVCVFAVTRMSGVQHVLTCDCDTCAS